MCEGSPPRFLRAQCPRAKPCSSHGGRSAAGEEKRGEVMKVEVELEKLEKLRDDMERLVGCLVHSGVKVEDEILDKAMMINAELHGLWFTANL